MRILINVSAFIFIFLTFFVVLPIFTFAAFADSQKFTVQNNDMISAVISEKELTRIVFERDQIERIYAIGGELNYEITGGALFLRPVASNKPVNFFIETVKGQTYQFLATTKDIPAVQIFVKSKNSQAKNTKTKNTNQNQYTGENLMQKSYAKIIDAAVANDKSAGFSKEKISLRKKFKSGFSMEKDSIWRGERLVAVKYIIENVSYNLLSLKRSDFQDKGIDGVYLEHEQLKPNQKTVLILIKQRKEQE